MPQEDFDVPTRTPAPKPAPGEPNTNPRAGKSATPTSSTVIAQAVRERQEGYKEAAPEAPAATPVSDATQDSMPSDMRKAVLRACKSEAKALLEAHAFFEERDAKMYGIIDCHLANQRRDAILNCDLTPENFMGILEQWVILAVIASKPEGYGRLLQAVELWRFREFQLTVETARAFYKRIAAEVERLKAQAVESERSFFGKLFGGKRTTKESSAGRFVEQMCANLTDAGPSWDLQLQNGISATGFSSGVLVPARLLELAQEAVSLPE